MRKITFVLEILTAISLWGIMITLAYVALTGGYIVFSIGFK